MFGQQILQLGDALVDSVTSLLLDESVRQLVSLLGSDENIVGETWIYFKTLLQRFSLWPICASWIYLTVVPALHAPPGFVHINREFHSMRKECIFKVCSKLE